MDITTGFGPVIVGSSPAGGANGTKRGAFCAFAPGGAMFCEYTKP